MEETGGEVGDEIKKETKKRKAISKETVYGIK